MLLWIPNVRRIERDDRGAATSHDERFPRTRMTPMIRWTRYWLIAVAQLAFALDARSAVARSAVVRSSAASGDEVTGVDGIGAVLAAFDDHPVVALGDLQGCAELHDFVRELVRDPRFAAKARTIVVDFGNPSLQSLVDRYVTDGEAIPFGELRHVWDDTTESPSLTWDSAVYARFFDAVRAVNSSLATERRLRVIVADAPIDWKAITSRPQWLGWREEKREIELAAAIRRVLDDGQRALVVAAASHLVRAKVGGKSARMLLDADHPGRMLTILPQGELGDGALRTKIESGERKLDWNSVIDLRSSWIGTVAIDAQPGSKTLRDSAEELLFLDDAKQLTRVQAPASSFQDDEFWNELNRRWRVVRSDAFDLARAGFDASGTLEDVSQPLSSSAPERRSGSRPKSADPIPEAPADASTTDGLAFVEEKLEHFPIVALGDIHMCAEFHAFVKRVVRDPRLVGKVQEFVVESGNPNRQALVDEYVVEGKSIPLETRASIWREAAMGWYAANSPVYSEFFDAVRDVNQKLAKDERFRVVLGDAPIDLDELRANPEAYLAKLGAHRETAQDPREIALAASVNRILDLGHRAIVIAGNGHLRAAGGRENARTAIEQAHPNAVFLIDANGPEFPGWRRDSIVVSANDPEPNHAKIYLAPWESLTGVRPSPLLARDREYWKTIGVVERLTRRRAIDFASPPFEYVSRYFFAPPTR